MNKKLFIVLLALMVSSVSASFGDCSRFIRTCSTKETVLPACLDKDPVVVVHTLTKEAAKEIFNMSGSLPCRRAILIKYELFKELLAERIYPRNPSDFARLSGVENRFKLVIYDVPADYVPTDEDSVQFAKFKHVGLIVVGFTFFRYSRDGEFVISSTEGPDAVKSLLTDYFPMQAYPAEDF